MSAVQRSRTRVEDILVGGGGIAGLGLALAVKRARPGAAVAICDPSPEPRRTLRAVAVAAGPRRFLNRLGVWQRIAPEAQAMTRMAITDSRPQDAIRPAYLGIAGGVDGDEPFAHMVFHDELRAALREACEVAGIRQDAAQVTDFSVGGGTVAVATSGGAFRARLLVAADGGRSRLRQMAGIGTVGWDYGQAGIIATVSHEIPHDGRAIQHFLPSGPLAILPLRAADGTPRRFSLVWTTGNAEAARLVGLPAAAFLAELESIIGNEFGTMTLDDVPRAQPLRLVLPRRLVGDRFALVGDAARTIHPLAGQGLNLGLRDAAVLAENIVEQLDLGLDPGSADVLRNYERARRFDGVVMAAATDGLNRLFSNESTPVRLLRDLGLGLVDRMPSLKELFVRDAAGLEGAAPRAFGAPSNA